MRIVIRHLQYVLGISIKVHHSGRIFCGFFYWENFLISSIVAITMYCQYGVSGVIHSRYICELSRQIWIRYNIFLKNRKKIRPGKQRLLFRFSATLCLLFTLWPYFLEKVSAQYSYSTVTSTVIYECSYSTVCAKAKILARYLYTFCLLFFLLGPGLSDMQRHRGIF